MAGLALIISIIALILSYLAYTRSGGSTEELKTKVEDLGISTENFREKTADALDRLEKIIRGENKKAKEEETVDRETEGQKDSTQ
jgi:hypothetical protein